MEASETDSIRKMAISLLDTADSLCADIRRKFQDETQDMLMQIHRLLNPVEPEATTGKRKLQNIIEDESTESTKKKNRSSGNDEDNHTFADLHSKSNTSTPIEKSVLQTINNDKSKDHISVPVTDSDQGIRSKRDASLKATSINNKLLNLKMNGKMRRTNSSKSNIYDGIIESDKENFHEILQTNHSSVKSVENDVTITDENETITSNDITKENSKNVVEDNLMPPPKMPIKKKRGAKTYKNATQSSDDFDSELNMEKPAKKLRRKKTHETSIENTDETTLQQTINTRLTRSQARLIHTSTIIDVVDTTHIVIKNKTKKKLTNKHTDTLNCTDEKIESKTSIEIEKPTENKHRLTYNKRSVEDSHQDSPSTILIKDNQSNNEDNSINDPLPQVGQETNYLQEIDDSFANKDITISKCLPLMSSTLAIENPVVENVNNQKNSVEHVEENIETPKVSKSSNHLVENAHSKNTNFDQTITLPQKNVPLPAAVNETVVLSKENEDLYNASRSFLEDDQSEVEETPSKIPKPLLKLDIGKNKLFESPVKSCVKHFERLAEISKMNNNSGIPSSNMLTRKKSRAGTSKLPIQDLTDNPLKKKAVDNKIDVTNHIPSQKNMSPLDKKINGKGQQANSAVQKEHWKYRKRDEKLQAAALAREAQEKLRQAQLEKAEKERQEKARQFQLEREEKLQEAKKKKLAQQRRFEMEEKRKEELNRKLLLSEQRDEMSKRQHLEKIVLDFNKMIQDDEDIENEKSEMSEKEKRVLREQRKPDWAKSESLDKLISSQSFIIPSVIDSFYQTDKFVPNLLEIFPGIKSTKLQRNSSAVWKTPPRCSMMPKIFE